MRIHQITDLHVPDDDGDDRFRHVRENVRRQLDFVAREEPDLLVISGDLTMTDASRVGCEWIHSNLPEVPVAVIPGNHDDPDIVWEVFGPDKCPHRRFFAVQTLVDCTLVFLDTSTDRLPREQIDFLTSLDCEDQAVLFLHHPPHLIGEGFMSSNQPLINYAEVAEAIRSAGIRHVFCGHYHNSAAIACDGFDLYLTPSPAFQIDLDSKEFCLEAFEPAVRTIQVDSGVVSTRLVTV